MFARISTCMKHIVIEKRVNIVGFKVHFATSSDPSRHWRQQSHDDPTGAMTKHFGHRGPQAKPPKQSIGPRCACVSAQSGRSSSRSCGGSTCMLPMSTLRRLPAEPVRSRTSPMPDVMATDRFGPRAGIGRRLQHPRPRAPSSQHPSIWRAFSTIVGHWHPGLRA